MEPSSVSACEFPGEGWGLSGTAFSIHSGAWVSCQVGKLEPFPLAWLLEPFPLAWFGVGVEWDAFERWRVR